MDQPLAGRVGVVTGASSGIGAATARALAASGMAVMLGARRAPALAALCEEIRAAGGQADFRATDLRDEASIDALVDGAVARFGALDAIVNNAAMGTIGPLVTGRTDDWRAVLETNVLGTMIACRAALRHMLPRRRGDVLIMGSAAAHEPWPHFTAYAASKAALHGLARALRAEVSAEGIRVLTIDVHNVAGTDFASGFDPAALGEAIQRWIRIGVLNPQAPVLSADDVARAIVFQLSQPGPASVHALSLRSREN